MYPTDQLWALLVKDIKQLGLFNDVQAMPINKITDDEFTKHFPDAKPPACFVVYLGEDDSGDRPKRITSWSAIIAVQDLKGDASMAALKLKDQFKDKFLGRDVHDVWIKNNSKVAPAITKAEWGVYEILFETMELDV